MSEEVETVVGQYVKDDRELVDVGIKAKYYIFSMYMNTIRDNYKSRTNEEARTSDRLKAVAVIVGQRRDGR